MTGNVGHFKMFNINRFCHFFEIKLTFVVKALGVEINLSIFKR